MTLVIFVVFSWLWLWVLVNTKSEVGFSWPSSFHIKCHFNPCFGETRQLLSFCTSVYHVTNEAVLGCVNFLSIKCKSMVKHFKRSCVIRSHDPLEFCWLTYDTSDGLQYETLVFWGFFEFSEFFVFVYCSTHSNYKRRITNFTSILSGWKLNLFT